MSSVESVTVNDCIILGNAVPEQIRDFRRTVCTVAYSKELGLIRIYPVPPMASIERWNQIEITLERNKRDQRRESWKIKGSKREWDTLHRKIKLVKTIKKKEDKLDLVSDMLTRYGVNCVGQLNKERLSLGFIKPTIENYELVERKNHDSGVQMTLDKTQPFLTSKNYPSQPRITYRCSDCTSKNPHNQQIIEWGVYEYMRKNPQTKENIWDNLRLTDPEWEIPAFLIGNLFRHRSSFMVISIYRFKKRSQ
jgi:hypothetical protein